MMMSKNSQPDNRQHPTDRLHSRPVTLIARRKSVNINGPETPECMCGIDISRRFTANRRDNPDMNWGKPECHVVRATIDAGPACKRLVKHDSADSPALGSRFCLMVVCDLCLF